MASALVTFDGTATTIALPAMARDLFAPVSRVQWIVNGPLLALAAMLLPAGVLGDRYGRGRMVRIGLIVFATASIGCALSSSDLALIAAKFTQGCGGALVLPAALALLRDAESGSAERTRLFGVLAAWTGAASAAGPLLAGALVDVASWRAVFVPSIVISVVALAVLGRFSMSVRAGQNRGPLPALATVALAVLLGGVAYLLIQSPRRALTKLELMIPVMLTIGGGIVLIQNRQRHILFPRELLKARNCVPANATTFALYFGMFGLSFLLVMYVQQVLRYSASWAAIVLLPMSVMLLFAERFGKLTAVVGTRPLVVAGAFAASAGIAWMGGSPHPVPFWSHLMVGTALFGLGVSAAVSTLTHAAVAAVPESCAGVASGFNHAVVRAAGLLAVAALGSVAAPGVSDAISAEGFQRAMLTCAAIVAVGALAGTAHLRDDEPGALSATSSA
jgi:MFS family permease